MDDLDTVADKEYLAAYDKATEFVKKLGKLPGVIGIDMSDAETIDELEKIYNEMNEYEKSFLAKDVVKTLNQYIEKLKEVRLAAGEDDTTQGTDDNDDKTEGVEGSGTDEA